MKRWMALGFASLLACAHVRAADLRDGLNSYASKDYKVAFAILAPLADLGNPRAQLTTGRMLLEGNGVDQDAVKGYGWLLAAAENGATEAPGLLTAERAKLTDAQVSEAQAIAARYGRDATALLDPLPNGPAVVSGLEPPHVGSGLEKNAELQKAMQLVMAQSGWMFTNVMLVTDEQGQVRDTFIIDSQPTRNISQVLVEAFHGIRWTPARGPAGPVPGTLVMSVHYMFGQSNVARQLRNNISRMKREAANGDDGSQYLLAMLERYFKELPGGDIDAPALLESAAAQGKHSRAMYARVFSETGDKRDKALGDISQLLKIGRAGLQPVQIEIGLAAWGEQSPAGYARARRWFAAARNGGAVEANKYLAALLIAHPVSEADDTTSAVKLAREATASWHGEKDPDAWQVLAAAQAKAGQFTDAVMTQKKALELARNYGWAVTDLERRLGAYSNSRAISEDIVIIPAIDRGSGVTGPT